MNIRDFNIILNLPPDLSDDEWAKVSQVYSSIEGFIEGSELPCWFGEDGNSRYICVSAEPSGLLCFGRIEEGIWVGWVSQICARLSLALGREVSDAEM